MCITETLTTLVYGGSVCIPSESDRRDNLAQSMNEMQVNWAYLTPTVASLLDPDSVPSLETLILGGEKVSNTDSQRWAGYVDIINAYGPTECCVLCTAYFGLESFESGLIGKPVGSVSWVVNRENHNKLAPVGSVGELLIEGPILARGYLKDQGKTEAAFIHDPAWLLEGSGGWPGRRGRLYKTGDLVYYRSDGNLVYVGRKDDDQVKVRGQRVELGEIEHHLAACVPATVQQMAVEAISLKESDQDGNRDILIAAFLQLNDKTQLGRPQGNGISDSNTTTNVAPQVVLLPEVDEMMADCLPRYMLPDVYFALLQLPMAVSGKKDRKRLREIGASFSAQELAELRASRGGMKRLPSTETEQTMQRLWAHVLNIKADTIGMNDSFFHLGGDSIAAMRLVAKARKLGIQLTVESIFRNPKLMALSNLQTSRSPDEVGGIAAFSLLNEDADIAQIREEAALTCKVDASIIEDIYPCSPLQEGLMSLTSKRYGDYIMQSMLALLPEIDEDGFRAAWEYAAQSSPVLRTRIVQDHKSGLLQVVLAEQIQWTKADNLQHYLEKDKSSSMELGDPLVRYAFVEEGLGNHKKRWFVWTIHHALYDGWSLPRIMDSIIKIYNGGVMKRQADFNSFIQHLTQQDQEAAAIYWQTALAHCHETAVIFPPLPPAVQQPRANEIITHQCPPIPSPRSDITASTLIRAAWAIVASRYTNSDDVVFGTTLTGRNAPVAGIETMIGSTIATVPVRVRVSGNQAVSTFLEEVQQQSIDMMPYEQTGLQRIAKLGTDARYACNFQTLLVVHVSAAGSRRTDEGLGDWRGNLESQQDLTTYGLVLQCVLAAEGMQITATFDTRVLEEWLLERVLSQFSFVLQQLAVAGSDGIVADLDAITPEDRREIWTRNAEMPPVINRCTSPALHVAGLSRL